MITGIVLVAVTIGHALAIKGEFKVLTGSRMKLETFPLDTVTKVEIMGTAPKGMELRVFLSHSKQTTVQYTNHDFIHIVKEGTGLRITIDHLKGYRSKVQQAPKIYIQCPRLESVSMVGTPLDSLDLPKDSHLITRQYYSKSIVKMDGYTMNKLYMHASNGAQITLSESGIDSLHVRAGESGTLIIHGNTVGHANLVADKKGKIEVNNPKMRSLQTHIDLEGELLMKGTDLKLDNSINQ